MQSPTDIPDDTANAPRRSWWSMGAVLCLVVGAVLYLAGRPEWAFVAGALGAVAWFMNMRGQLHQKNVEADAERERYEEDEDEEDANDDEA